MRLGLIRRRGLGSELHRGLLTTRGLVAATTLKKSSRKAVMAERLLLRGSGVHLPCRWSQRVCEDPVLGGVFFGNFHLGGLLPGKECKEGIYIC